MRHIAIILAVGAMSVGTGSLPGQRSVIEDAARALGADSVKTLQFTASGATFSVGQNYTPSEPWPRVTLKRYTALIDYGTASMRLDLVREMGATMPRGGGVPFTGELHQIQGSNAQAAWDVPIPANPAAGSLPTAPCTPPEAGGTAAFPVPPASHVPCALVLWATPQGFVKAAIANHATLTPAAEGTAVSFSVDGTHKMTGTIDAPHHVTRVQTWIDQSIIGDMLVETEFTGYRDFGGIEFPSHIVQKQDGFPALDLTVHSVVVNPRSDIAPPAAVSNVMSPQPITVTSHTIADGVFWLTGGMHHSLVIAMKDYSILVDAPNGEARGLAVIAKAKDSFLANRFATSSPCTTTGTMSGASARRSTKAPRSSRTRRTKPSSSERQRRHTRSIRIACLGP
jgi:hypothetical protein